MELPGTGPAWSLHAAPDGWQVQMRGIAIGQHPTSRNVRGWFDQESVLSASRSKKFKYQVKLQEEPEESSLALGKQHQWMASCTVFSLIMEGVLLVFCKTELCFVSIYLILGFFHIF